MGPAQDANLCPLRSRFAPRRCSYNKTKTCPEPVGAPAPGANECLSKTQIRARFVRGSHRGGAPTTKPKPPANRRSTRPGCEWGPARDANLCPLRSRFAPGAVLLQQKTKTCPPEPVGAPAPGANGGLPGALICARRVRGSHRGGAPTAKNQNRPRTVGAPAPGANGACPGRKSVPASFAVRTEAVLLQQKPKPAPTP